MAAILRGYVVWADLDPTKGQEQSGKRPVLIVNEIVDGLNEIIG
jgi:mRNA-degrading endonuclease toxin of MazEF toxin-antitoxin module